MPSDAQYLGWTLDTWQQTLGAAALGVARPAAGAVHPARPRRSRRRASPAGCSRPRSPPASSASPRRAPARSTSPPPSCSGSSATCTTARRRGSWRWRWTSAWPRSASTATPRARRELVGEAREEAKRALAELRDLARGIRPSLLAERGLGAGDRRARRPQPGARDGDLSTSRAARPRRSRRRPGSSSPKRSRTRPSTAAPRRATVWVTRRDGDLHVEVVDDGRGGADPDGAGLQGPRPARRGARRLARGQQPARRADGRAGGAAVRVVIAEDLALLRDGLERLLRDSGFDVVAAVADGDALLDRRRASTSRTSRSSTSGSRRRSATRACAPRSSCAAAGPASRC